MAKLEKITIFVRKFSHIIMAKQKNAPVEHDPEAKIENALGQTEVWLERNWRPIAIIIGTLLVVAAAIYGYQMLVKAPREAKAADAMYVAEQRFIAEDYATALNGDGNDLGFAAIVEQFGGTRAGRLAAHYAGICRLKEGDWEGALMMLEKYKPVEGAPGAIIDAQNAGLRGDIYVQKGDYAAAVTQFRRAVEFTNDLTTPIYLKKLGLALEQTGDPAAAVEAYQRVADDFGTSLEAREIEKYISAAKQKM